MGQLTNLYVSESYQGLLKLANSTTGVTGTLQYVQDGLGHNIPMLVSTSSVVISGSFYGDGSNLTGITSTVDTGSLVTTSSFNAYTSSNDAKWTALGNQSGSWITESETGSFATTASLTSLSSSIASTDLSQNNRLNSIENITGSLQNQINQKLDTGSFNTYTSSVNSKLAGLDIETGSLQTQIDALATTASLSGYTTVTAFNNYTSSNDNKVNSLIANTGSYATTSSLTSLSQSIATTDLGQDNRLGSLESKTGSYATTGSNNFQGNQTITGSLGVTGEITALSASITYLKTIYQTSSVIFTSGSNILGDESSDTQTLWGTVKLPSGPLSVTGSVTSSGGFNGNLTGTASYATNALSSSWASYIPDITGSLVQTVGLLSPTNDTLQVIKANGTINTVQIDYVSHSISSSHSINADTASYFNGTIASASYAVNADTASIARDVIVVGKCDNTGGLTRGTVVRITGANGDNPLFDSASWNDEANSANVLGMLSEDVAYNGFANVVVLGKVLGLNTNAYAPSTLLYLSSSGQFTSTIPTAPSQSVRLGQVLRQNVNQGSIYFRADNGYELGELHNVVDTANTTGELLAFTSGSFGLWKNQTIGDLGIATTSSVNQKLDTGSFNTYTASMDARTGSYATTGSNTFNGNQIILGSVDIRSGSLDLLSSTTPNIDLYLSNSVNTQANIIKGWGDNFSQGGAGSVLANFSGSLRITGSNNIVSLPQLRATAVGGGADLQGYISGSDNMIMGNTAGIYLNTGSLLFPKTQNNILGNASTILMNFTTSSLAGGHPVITNNFVQGGTIQLNANSGSFTAVGTNIINGGSVISTQNFVTNNKSLITQNNINNTTTLNHISSSITYQGNISNAPITVNNHVSSSNITNNFVSVANNTFFGGSNSTGHQIYASGSQSSNSQRYFTDNLIGGRNNIVSSSFVSSSASNLLSTLIYGQALYVSGNHASTAGGSAFLGRYNDATSLHLAQDVVFAVGTGTGNTNRRTGLYVTSGSLVGVSGSLDVKGGTTISGSLLTSGSVTITGSVQGYVLPLSVTSNTASLNLDNGNFFELALTGSQDIRIEPSNIKPGQTVNIKLNTTGSGTVSFPATVKQASGSAYVPTTAVGTDIITLVSFDSSNVYLANVKNLI